LIISILCKPIQYWNMSNMWSDAYLKSKKFTIPVVHPNNVRWGALTSLHSSFTNCAVPAMLEFKTSCQLRAHASTSFWFWFECLLVIYTSLFCGWYHKKTQREFKTCQCWETQPPNQVCELHFRWKSTGTVILQQLGALTCSPQSRSGSYVHPKTRCMLEVLTHSILYHSWWKPYRSFKLLLFSYTLW